MRSIVVGSALVAALAAVPAKANEELLKKHACVACHQVEKKVVGPGYKEVAAKYRGQANAPALLAEKIKKGGQGTWGPVPMPPNAAVSDADIKAMVTYILALK
jgi:cytochrome c